MAELRRIAGQLRSGLIGAAALLAGALSAAAQTPGPGPGGGFRPPLFDDPSDALRRATAAPDPDARAIGPRTEVRFTSQTPPPNADDIRFQLNDLLIEGATVYDRETLLDAAGDAVGREASLTEVFAAAGALQALYRDDGYLFTRVVVPAQRIDGGVVRLEVIEAVLSTVAVEEPADPVGPVRALAERIVAPLDGLVNPTTQDIEEVLLRLNDIPGVTRAAAVPKLADGERGAVDLFINMERDPIDISAFVDNKQSPIIGDGLMGAVASVNSWSPFGDTTTLSGFMSAGFDDPFPADFRERWTVQAEHQTFIGASGLNLRLRALYSESRPGDIIAQFDVVSDQTEVEAFIWYPAHRARSLSLDLFAGFEVVEINSITPAPPTAAGVPDLVVDDRLNVLSFGIEGLQRDALGYTEGRLEVRRGFDILGTSMAGDQNISRADGAGEFWLVKGEVERTLPVTDGWTLWGKLWGQYAERPLLASEEFSIGGAELGRAYFPSEYSGDIGAGAALELRWNRNVSWREFRAPVEVYGFGDLAEVRNLRTGQPVHAAVASAGGGIRTQLPGSFALNLEAARPLNRPLQYNGSDAWRFFFSATRAF